MGLTKGSSSDASLARAEAFVNSVSSLTVSEDCESLRIEFGLIRLPLARVQFFEALISENFELLVGLLQLGIHVPLIELIALAHSVLFIGLVPLSVASNRVELARVTRVMFNVVLSLTSLHNRVLGVPPSCLRAPLRHASLLNKLY